MTFDVASATEFPGREYDLVCFFDGLHDMKDPTGAALRAKEVLASGGTWMIVEPFAAHRPEALRRIAMEARFTGFRRAVETPFNLVAEAKP